MFSQAALSRESVCVCVCGGQHPGNTVDDLLCGLCGSSGSCGDVVLSLCGYVAVWLEWLLWLCHCVPMWLRDFVPEGLCGLCGCVASVMSRAAAVKLCDFMGVWLYRFVTIIIGV